MRRSPENFLRLVLCALLAACASSVPQVAVDQKAVDTYRNGGYAIQRQPGVTWRRFTAPVTQVPWSFTLAQVPGHDVSRPVIIYLPALGDADDAPSKWVELWARAGYAVICIQPLDDDARIWTTPEARSGDFERVARGRFTDDLMADRLARLASLVKQTYTRSKSNEPALAGLDWSRVALAGSDLGAYTVQTVAALAPEQLKAAGWPFTPVAYIALSPFSWRAARSAAPASPPASAHGPVLMISARDDVDAYGVITDVGLRHQAFDALVSGDDFYLELNSATHRWLEGVTTDLNSPDTVARRPPAPRDANGTTRPVPTGDTDGVAPEDDVSPDVTAKMAASRKEREIQAANARSRLLTRAAMSEVGVEDVSVAFLDATVRQDTRARAWLIDGAPAWLQNGDRLKHR
jgi:hypothetical protein